MSGYHGPAIHPLTRKIEQAEYLDDYFGRHAYGVMFNDGTVWRLEQLPDFPAEPAPRALRHTEEKT